MRALPLIFLALSASITFGQDTSAPAAFDVASVRPSQHAVGPDYNNQIAYLPAGITARNVTLKRLIAEAYHLQLNQISGPDWLDRNEYAIEAKASAGLTPQQMGTMLRSLLIERFKLRQHRETREMRVYELAVSRSGSKISPADNLIEGLDSANGGAGFHFRGDMRELADLLAIKLSMPPLDNPGVPVRSRGLSIPVIDETGLPGVFDFRLNIQPEVGTDMFTLWQRALQDQLGLTLENRKTNVEILIVDDAATVPTEN